MKSKWEGVGPTRESSGTAEKQDIARDLRRGLVLGPRRYQSVTAAPRPVLMPTFPEAGISPSLCSALRHVALLVPGEFALRLSATFQLSSCLCLPPGLATDVHLYKQGSGLQHLCVVTSEVFLLGTDLSSNFNFPFAYLLKYHRKHRLYTS